MRWTDEDFLAVKAEIARASTVGEALRSYAHGHGSAMSTAKLAKGFHDRGWGTPKQWLQTALPVAGNAHVAPSVQPVESGQRGLSERNENPDEPDILSHLIELTRKRPILLLDLCDKLDASPGTVREAVTWAQTNGYHVRLEAGHVFTRLAVGPSGKVEIGSTTPGRKHVALFTDIHFGSRHCNDRALRKFLARAVDMGCETAACTGDILDGHSPKLTMDQRAIGMDDQLSEALSTFEGFKLPVVAISGNHDGYHSTNTGIDCGRVIEERMRAQGVDWHHLGSCLGEAKIHGADWQLWHPHGGAATRNAVRRVLNSRAEIEAARAKKLSILVLGHFHKHVSFTAYPERTFCVAGGCFQEKGSEFSNRIANDWDVGGTIVSYTVADDGGVSEFAAEFFPVAA